MKSLDQWQYWKRLKNLKKNFNKKINYEIYPLLNPTGYDLNQRNNNDNRDLNCINKITLKSDNYTEIQALTNSLKNKKYNALISLHENLSKDKFYAYWQAQNLTDVLSQM